MTDNMEIIDSQFVYHEGGVDTGFMIDALRDPKFPDTHIEFNIYEAVKLDDGSVMLQDQSPVGGSFTTTDRTKAEVFINGYVKWDGCSNWSFYPADNRMIHLCGPTEAGRGGVLIKLCYRIAHRIIPNADWKDTE